MQTCPSTRSCLPRDRVAPRGRRSTLRVMIRSEIDLRTVDFAPRVFIKQSGRAAFGARRSSSREPDRRPRCCGRGGSTGAVVLGCPPRMALREARGTEDRWSRQDDERGHPALDRAHERTADGPACAEARSPWSARPTGYQRGGAAHSRSPRAALRSACRPVDREPGRVNRWPPAAAGAFTPAVIDVEPRWCPARRRGGSVLGREWREVATGSSRSLLSG